MNSYQTGEAVIYLRPREKRGDDGWYDRIPARYIYAQPWGRGTRHKITWQENGEWQHRFVNVLSIQRADPTGGSGG